MASAGRLLAVGINAAVEVGDAGNSRARVEKTRRGKIKTLQIQLGLQRSGCGVARINRAGVAIELDRASAGKICTQGERKLRGKCEILYRDIHILVDTSFGGIAGVPNRNHTILDAQFSDRKILLKRLIRIGLSWRR